MWVVKLIKLLVAVKWAPKFLISQWTNRSRYYLIFEEGNLWKRLQKRQFSSHFHQMQARNRLEKTRNWKIFCGTSFIFKSSLQNKKVNSFQCKRFICEWATINNNQQQLKRWLYLWFAMIFQTILCKTYLFH